MAVRIRLKRMGRRNRAFWRICATDKRAARDGRVIEEIGSYDPEARNKDKVRIKRDRVCHWLKVGALPSETVEQLMLHVGIDRRGNEIEPRPWRKRKTPPPAAAKRIEKEKAKEKAEAAKPAEVEAEQPAKAEAAADAAPEAQADQPPKQELEAGPSEQAETADEPAPDEAAEEQEAAGTDAPEDDAAQEEKPAE